MSIAVSDTGCGMEPDTIEQAFEPFFTTKPIGQGTGLGLSMVYGFARQSQGYAKIFSKVGLGTTISLYLPHYRGRVSQNDLKEQEFGEHLSPSSDGEKIIVVIEDESTVREIVVTLLQDLGHRPLFAADGTSGLELLQQLAHVDLLITDVGLPGLNGRQVADAARLVHPDLKVMFMTGYADKVGAGSAAMQPGMHMITKPISLDSLASRLKDIL